MARKILIQLDTDPQPSTFDAIVAVDAGAEVLLRHGGVTPENVVPLVYGAMFTRGDEHLASTAIFVGGSNFAAAEAVADRVRRTFFDPIRVSVMLDPNGSNTTAAAAVVAIGRHVRWQVVDDGRQSAVVLGGTGPVGQRVARLLARKRVRVTIVSRTQARAQEVAASIAKQVPGAQIVGVEAGGDGLGPPVREALSTADIVVAAGAPGATLLPESVRPLVARARVLIDLSAVPPPGIAWISATDKARHCDNAKLYGALGVGGTKMKIHKAAIAWTFSTADAFLDAEELLAIGESLAPDIL